MKRFFFCVPIFLFVLCLNANAWALNIQHFRPSTGSMKGYQVLTSDTLKQGQFSLGLVTNYGHGPLTMRIDGQPDQYIVDDLLMGDFLIDVAAFDWMMVNLDVPLTFYESIQATNPTVTPNSNTGGNLGDIAIRFKFQIFDAEKTSSGLGLAFVPQIDIPTGRNSKFIGDETVSGSIKAIGDWQIHSNRIYANIGYKLRDREIIGDDFLVVDDELLYGIGFQRPLVKKWDLDVIAELYGSAAFASNPRTMHRIPLEGIGLLQKRWFSNKSLISTLGGGGGFTDGYGNPRYRVICGLSYVHPEKISLPPLEPTDIREKINIPDKIHFEFDKAIIRKVSYPILDNIVSILMANMDITKVQVEGHTDSLGSDVYNQRLSERRSQAVVEYMVLKGIARDRLMAIGYGEAKPIETNDTTMGRAINRRIEFYVVEKK